MFPAQSKEERGALHVPRGNTQIRISKQSPRTEIQMEQTTVRSFVWSLQSLGPLDLFQISDFVLSLDQVQRPHAHLFRDCGLSMNRAVDHRKPTQAFQARIREGRCPSAPDLDRRTPSERAETARLYPTGQVHGLDSRPFFGGSPFP